MLLKGIESHLLFLLKTCVCVPVRMFVPVHVCCALCVRV